MMFVKFVVLWLLGLGPGFCQDLGNEFLLPPKDMVFYYNSPKYLEQLCAPPRGNPQPIVTWRKDNKTLQIKNRVIMMESMDIRKINMLSLSNLTKVYSLAIQPLLLKDQGTYSCVASNDAGEREAKFTIKITNKCEKGSWKCTYDKTCIMSSALCDGISHCGKGLDESIEAGCALPSVPTNLHEYSSSPYRITVRWKPVNERIRYYEALIIYPNGKREKKKVNADSTVLSVKGLLPDRVFTVMIRSKSLTGFSNYSHSIKIRTLSKDLPISPTNLHCKQKGVSYLTMKWDNVKDTFSYDIIMTAPNGHVKTFLAFPTLPEVIAKNLDDDTSYSFKVRARSKFGISDYCPIVNAKTLPLGHPGPPVDIITFIIRQNVSFSWTPTTMLSNSGAHDLYYFIQYCILLPYYEVHLVNRTDLVANTPKPNILNRTTAVNNTSTSQPLLKDETKKDFINVTKQVEMKILKYEKTDCKKTEKISQRFYTLHNLEEGKTYSYKITTYGYRDIKGGSHEGNFTTEMNPTEPSTTPNNLPYEEFSGIIVFGIVSGGLIALLILFFILAYCCKWKFLMEGIEDYKTQKKKPEKNLLQQDLTTSDLLLDNYRKL